MTRAFVAIRLAFAFLTIVRIPIEDREVTPRSLADARFAYPLVGLTLGLILAGLSEASRRFGVGVIPSAFFLVASTAILTGGLHLDGLADTADGLFLWGDPARRLEVMRDPHVGSFGVVALILVILGKFAALATLGGPGRWGAVLGALIVSRCLIQVTSGLAPYARPEGTGRVIVEATTWRDGFVSSGLVVVVGVTLAGWVGLIASLWSLILAAGMARMARARLGGVTGDILGAVVELGEFGFLMILAVRPS